MSEHTQGPWFAHAVHRDGFMTSCVTLEDDQAGAQHGYARYIVFEGLSHNNARLIAAAPDMLAALKAFIADYENPAQTCHNGYTAEKVRAAIAKAEP